MSASTRQNQMPNLVVVADGFARNLDRRNIGQVIKASQTGKLPWVLLRDYGVPPVEFREAAVMVVRNIRLGFKGAEITINRRLDLAYDLGTGIHLGNNFEQVEFARRKLGRTARIGVSLHHGEEVDKRLIQFVDYAFYSPIFWTSSKPDSRPINKEGLERFCNRYPELKVFALGGVTPEKVGVCFDAGAYGVAVASGITRSSRVSLALQKYNQAIIYSNRKRRAQRGKG